jgi:hypothetical protein
LRIARVLQKMALDESDTLAIDLIELRVGLGAADAVFTAETQDAMFAVGDDAEAQRRRRRQKEGRAAADDDARTMRPQRQNRWNQMTNKVLTPLPCVRDSECNWGIEETFAGS